MQLQKNLWLLAGFAAVAIAQDDSVCDPANGDNNDSTCTSSVQAMNTDGGLVATSSFFDTNTLLATETSVAVVDINSKTVADTGAIVITSTTTGIDTVQQSLITSSSVSLDRNTVVNTDSSVVPIVVNTLSGGNTDTDTTGPPGTAAGTGPDETSSTSDSGAQVTGAANYALGGVAAAVFGLAAAL